MIVIAGQPIYRDSSCQSFKRNYPTPGIPECDKFLHINKSSSTSSSSSKSSSASNVYSISLVCELVGCSCAAKCGRTTASLLCLCRSDMPRLNVVSNSTRLLGCMFVTFPDCSDSKCPERRIIKSLSTTVRPDFFLYSREIMIDCGELEPNVDRTPSIVRSC